MFYDKYRQQDKQSYRFLMVVPLLRILTVLYRKHSYCLTPVRESSTERPVIFMKQQEIIFWTDPLLYKVKGKFQG